MVVGPVYANPKYASIVIDADTGQVLHQRYASKHLHPASLTKVMTLMMLFDAVDSGQVRMSDRIRVSAYAASMVPSKLGLAAGSTIRVRDAIPAMVIKSANDVAVAVAEHLGGSERNFAQMMNRRAKELGMRNTHFMNASGLHHRRQISTARDMARMAQYLVRQYLDYYRIFARKKFSYGGKTYRSHNKLLATYSGMDGLKTGYIGAAGFNLISSAVRDNRRIIGVVFGGKTSRSRNRHMTQLLDRGFAKMASIRLARARAVPAPTRRPDIVIQASLAPSVQPAAGLETQLPLMAGAATVSMSTVEPEPVEVAVSVPQPDDLIPPMAPKTGVLKQMARFDRSVRDASGDWAIQVGAFNDKGQTVSALQAALGMLPHYYAKGVPEIVPFGRGRKSVYRAWLSGYSLHDAKAACAYIPDCLAIKSQ